MREVRARVWSPVLAVLIGASAAVALSAACTDDFDVVPGTDGGDGDGSEAGRAQCPRDPPESGSPCTLPEGTTCSFGPCTVIVQCARGEWRLGTDPAAKPPCPELAPKEGTACPQCWPPAFTCVYGSTDCSLPDASLFTNIFSCPSAVWLRDERACRDGGGPDVQGDGGLDDD